jgi:type II secretory pathway pseudopilin PulG
MTRHVRMNDRASRVSPGYSLVEAVVVMAMATTVGGMAVPQLLASIDDYRTAGAMRYLAARVQQTRMEAIVRSREVAMKFTQAGGTYEYAVYVDGNGDGVRTHDINSAVDTALGAPERLGDQFQGVDFGVLPGLPSVDGGSAPPGNDPIKLGASNLLSFSANGTSSTGSLYIKGQRGAQYVIRVFGVTGKTRVLKFSRSTQLWHPL